MSKNMPELLDDILQFHEQETQRIKQYYQQQQQHYHKQVQQQLQQQLQQQQQAIHQRYAPEVEALRKRVEELQNRLQAATSGSSGGGGLPAEGKDVRVIEVEAEDGEDLYVAELNLIPVSHVNIMMVTPGAVVPMDEARWSGGRLIGGGGLDDELYSKIEAAINDEVRRIMTKLSQG